MTRRELIRLLATLPTIASAAIVEAAASQRSAADDLPVIPIGLDAYLMWERWPYQRIGARAYMRSTYDRTGGNEGADASHFLYQLADDFNVTLDIEGPGVLYFARYNHWHGSPWHYVIDGTDHIVRETSTADPTNPVRGSVFIPEDLFPNPLAWTWDITKGADLMWVPIPFERSFRMAYSRTRYGTGYYIFHRYVEGARLSRPIRAWNGNSAPDKRVMALINRAGDDLVAQAGSREGKKTGVRQEGGVSTVPQQGAVTLVTITRAPSMIRALDIAVPTNAAVDFSRVRLRITWDDRPAPSVDAPVALFYGTGTFYNRDGREYLVKGFPIHVRYVADRLRLACFFPMPFFRSARIELVGGGTAIHDVEWSVRYAPYTDPPSHVGYLHATYKDHGEPSLGKDLVLLDTREQEGSDEWSGHFVGTSIIFSRASNLRTLEGDPRFFFDGSLSPQAYGTGTEEWNGGGDYWGGRNMTLPFAGHPVGARSAKEAKDEQDNIQSAYRFLLADLMPFGRNARIQLEHGADNQSTEHYETVTYWYGIPAPSLAKTDELQIGDAASERAHQYVSPDASVPYDITSRYEWGPDTIDGQEIFPAHFERGRTTKGTSEFTLTLRSENHGVLLRRTLDYAFPNQRAEVYVDTPRHDGHEGRQAWTLAGIWFLAGSNTCVYSNPKEELGATAHVVQTSNRRFRDDEFLLPRHLTRGRSRIRVRVKFTPVEVPLFPGHPLPDLAWSEIKYCAYCFVMPRFSVPGIASTR
jgi:D-arabinan exo alpha-(1,3)/(1,5)-arabinofuranosidase (non-reducing end)